MTDEQVQSMLRAIEHAAETLNREGYEIPYGEPTQSALDVRFLLAHITVKNADLAAARADVARLREALESIVKADNEAITELRSHGLVASDYDPVIAKLAREVLAATTVPTVVPLAEVEALATALACLLEPHGAHEPWHEAYRVLAAYRAKHPKP